MSFTPPPAPAPAMPLPVVALQAVLWVELALGLCAGAIGAAGASALRRFGFPADHGTIVIYSIVTCIFAVFAGVIAFFVPRRRQWARLAAIALAGLAILTALFYLVTAFSVGHVVSLIIPAIVLVLAFTRPAKEWFTE